MKNNRLDHDLKYYWAVEKHARIIVVDEYGYAGYGDIIDFNDKVVTILDAETKERQHFIRENFQFYVERQRL